MLFKKLNQYLFNFLLFFCTIFFSNSISLFFSFIHIKSLLQCFSYFGSKDGEKKFEKEFKRKERKKNSFSKSNICARKRKRKKKFFHIDDKFSIPLISLKEFSSLYRALYTHSRQQQQQKKNDHHHHKMALMH